MAIHIRNQQNSKSISSRRVRKDLAAALSLLGCEEAELSVLFTGSARMKQLNALYRGIPKETDVLSFAMDEDFSPVAPPSHILGDIVISVPRTVEQARAYKTTFYEELLRLLLHGLLHLLGYDHEKSRYQKMKMEKMEKELLHAVTRLD